MTKILRTFAALALALALAGCASDETEDVTETTVAEDTATEEDAPEEDAEASGDTLPVIGELTYDGVTVGAGSTLVLTLTDLTDANPDTALKATETIALDDTVTSPIPFEVMIPREGLDRNLRYSLRAIINDESGVALLTTNSANFIDLEADISDLGPLELVSAG